MSSLFYQEVAEAATEKKVIHHTYLVRYFDFSLGNGGKVKNRLNTTVGFKVSLVVPISVTIGRIGTIMG